MNMRREERNAKRKIVEERGSSEKFVGGTRMERI